MQCVIRAQQNASDSVEVEGVGTGEPSRQDDVRREQQPNEGRAGRDTLRCGTNSQFTWDDTDLKGSCYVKTRLSDESCTYLILDTWKQEK